MFAHLIDAGDKGLALIPSQGSVMVQGFKHNLLVNDSFFFVLLCSSLRER